MKKWPQDVSITESMSKKSVMVVVVVENIAIAQKKNKRGVEK